ncbi:MAG: hypothetical protein CMO80_23170 [Verrucomicrobiales bacterium]|nr:hypothetical protein [Verrucomicrobiales bacterium]
MKLSDDKMPAPEMPVSETDSCPWLTTRRFALLLGGLLLLSFYPVLVGNQAWFYRDYGFLGYPFAFFNREALWSGEIPFWNPLIHCGVPHFAQWNTMVLYPGSLIYLLVPLPWGLAWFCVAHLFLGGMGMWRLVREDTGSNFGAAFAGVAFVFSGLVLACVIYPNYLVAFGWLPWVYLYARSAMEPDNWRALIKAVIAGSMQMLSGAPELILMTWLMIGAVVIARAWGGKERSAKLRASAGSLFCVVALIAGLCAFQLFPFFDLLLQSQRSLDTGDGFWSLPAWGWINFVAPLFSNFQTDQGVFVQAGQSFFPSVYLGVVTLALALLARGGKRFEIAVLWFCALIALLLAFGEAGFLYPLLKSVSPIGVARFPVKGVLLLGFIVPLLAGYGLATWERNRDCRRALAVPGLVVIAVVGAGIALGMNAPLPELRTPEATTNGYVRIAFLVGGLAMLFAWNRSSDAAKRLLPIALIALIWVDAKIHAPILNPTIGADAFEPGLAAAYHRQSDPDFGKQGRLMLSPEAEKALHRKMVPKFSDDFMGQRLAYWGNLNMLDAIPKVNGAATLTPKRWTLFETDLYQFDEMPDQSLMDFLGVSAVTDPAIMVKWQARAGGMSLASGGQTEQPGGPAAGTWWRGTNWNPRETVYVPRTAATNGSATITDFTRSRNSISCIVNCESESVIVVSETQSPGWKAYLDGKPAETFSANFAFLGVRVPAGEHKLKLKYLEKGFVMGSVLSVLTLMACFYLRRLTPSPPIETQ